MDSDDKVVDIASRRIADTVMWTCGECGGHEFYLPMPAGEAVCCVCMCTAEGLVVTGPDSELED